MLYDKSFSFGKYDFSCAIHVTGIVKSHLHNYSEFIYCLDGTGEVWVDEKKFVISKNQIIFIPPNSIHKYNCPNATTMYAVFSADMVPLFFKVIHNKRLVARPINIKEYSQIMALLLEVPKNDYIRISGYLNLLLAQILDASETEPATYTDKDLYQKVTLYISENYTENLSITSIANKFGYNQKYLSHILHEFTGMNFRKLLGIYRTNHAKELLKNTKMKITDVALECGFGATNTFQRVFKEITGLLPTQYRNSNDNN